MNRKIFFAVLLLVVWVGPVAHVVAQDDSWSNVRQDAQPAMVYLRTEIRYPNGLVDPIEGTGFLVHPDGWILTSAHVVPRLSSEDTKSGATLSATASIGGRGELKRGFLVKRRDVDKDLALLLLTHQPPQASPTLAIDLDAVLAPDQNVYALGFPAASPVGLDGTPGTIRSRLEEFWLTNASINPGHSGGPVFSKEGRVVGVSRGAVPNSEQMNVVIPIRFAKAWLDDIGVEPKMERAIKNCSVRWGTTVSGTLIERYRNFKDNRLDGEAAFEAGKAVLLMDPAKGQEAFNTYLQCLEPIAGAVVAARDGPADNPGDHRSTIVLIGSAEDYTADTRAPFKATSVELLHSRLNKFAIIEHTVSYSWERWQDIIDMRPRPAVIVMHASALHDEQHAKQAVGKFQSIVSVFHAFMPQTKLVVFSRLPPDNPSAELCQRWRRQVDFLTSKRFGDRLVFYPMPRNEADFNGQAGVEVAQIVRCLAGMDAVACSTYVFDRLEEAQGRVANSTCAIARH